MSNPVEAGLAAVAATGQPAPAAPAAPSTPATTLGAGKAPAAPSSPAVSMTGIDESWRNSLPEDLRNDPSIKITKSVEDLAKGYVHSQKMIGADKIVVPTKLTTDDEWRAIKTKLGLPDTADKYSLKVPEGVPADAPCLKKFNDAAHKIGVLPADALKLLDWYHSESVATQTAASDAAKAAGEAAVSSLKKEFGQAYDGKIKSAVSALEQLMGKDEAAKLIDDPTLGGHPEFIRLAVRLADILAEDTAIGEDGKPTGLLSPVEAQKRISTIMGDASHPHNLKDHPNHKVAVQEMTRLFEQLHPDVQ